MNIQKFTLKDIDYIKNQKPRLIFFSSDGAQGPSGLLTVIFKDKGYCLNHLSAKKELWDSFINNAMFLNLLFHLGKKDSDKDFDEYSYIYLGAGNILYISNDLIDKYKDKLIAPLDTLYKNFKDLLKLEYSVDIKAIYNLCA